MSRAVFVISAAALVLAGSSAAARTDVPTVQEVTITGGGGVQLACDLTVPAGTTPAGGWPGMVAFPSFGGGHLSVENFEQVRFAADGFASVSCDYRGTWKSGGAFDLAGPNDAQDAQAIFDWLAARPEVSDTQIGAFGLDLGGAEVWNAAAAGVPFKAIVPWLAWSSLRRALKPAGVLDRSMFNLLAGQGPTTWNTPSGIAARSHWRALRSLTVPTLILAERTIPKFAFDLSQATAAYRLLAGPKRLDIGWNGDRWTDVDAWLSRYLAAGPKIGGGVDIQHEAPDKTTTAFTKFPPTRFVNVNLPGSALTRSVLLPGGPLETFGGGSVTIRYSGASWKHVVAQVSDPSGTVVTEGAAPVKHRRGVLTIPLLNEAVLLPRGKKIVVTLSSHDTTFGGASSGKISVGRVTLKLSVLARAVSR